MEMFKLRNLTRKVIDIFIYLNAFNESITSHISKRIDITYSHVSKACRLFESEGLVKKESKGRSNIIRLTDKGKKLANELIIIKTIMEEK